MPLSHAVSRWEQSTSWRWGYFQREDSHKSRPATVRRAKHRSMEKWQWTSENLCFFWTAAQPPHIETVSFHDMFDLFVLFFFYCKESILHSLSFWKLPIYCMLDYNLYHLKWTVHLKIKTTNFSSVPCYLFIYIILMCVALLFKISRRFWLQCICLITYYNNTYTIIHIQHRPKTLLWAVSSQMRGLMI